MKKPIKQPFGQSFWTEADYKNKLEEVLDEQFPKGKCKERGEALVLCAWAITLIKRAMSEKL